MKRLSELLCLLSFALLSACQSDEAWITANTGFLISLEDELLDTHTRSTPAELEKPTTDKFHLKIINSATGTMTYDNAYQSGVIPASAGTYNLTASYGDNPLLAWDSPYYEGHATAEVTTGATSVIIPCTVANSLLSIEFSNPDLFAELYSTYSVKVKIGSSSLSIGSGDTGKSAYFRAGSVVSLSFQGVLADNGREVSTAIKSDNLPETFAAGTHTKLTLTASTPVSGTILTVDKVEIEKVTVSATIPMEWLPKPKISAFGGSAATLEYTETADAPENAVISYSACLPVQDVEFTLNFRDAQYAEYNNKTYTLSTLTEEERTAFGNIGISLPILDGTSTEGILDLKALTGNLLTDNDNEVTNTIKVRVKANNRWSSEEGESYSIKVKKPEFTVSVQEGNCWSKEFTIDEVNVTSGNAEKIKQNLVYQYSADGGNTWTDCSDGRLQQFTYGEGQYPKNKEYKVRALYRNTIDSNPTDAKLETPRQLPNSDMEEWYDSQLTSRSNPKIRTYFPWSSNESSFWNTNNEYTTRYRQGTFAYPYNSFPAVSYNPNAHSGKLAAELRNTASGNANTANSIFGNGTVQNYNKVAGILFTGDFKSNTGATPGNSYTKEDGREFDARPTNLCFWYKYAPYNNDTWQANIELWDSNKNVIIKQTFSSSEQQNEYKKINIQLDYEQDKEYAKCKYIYLIFRSTINEGDNMPFEKFKSTYILWKEQGAQQETHKEAHIGSVLTIDDISLIYNK